MLANAGSNSAPDTAHIELSMYGTVEVRGWVVRPRRRIATPLLCYLALHPDRPVSSDQLLNALWPLGSHRAEASRASLHTYLSELRKSLGEGVLPPADVTGGYQLAGGVRTDQAAFTRLSAEAANSAPDEARRLRRDALSLVRGRPFARCNDSTYEWLHSEHHLHEMEVAITDCAHELAVSELSAGRGTEAADAARRGLLAVPDSFVLHRDLIAAVQLGGDPAELRREWASARQALGEDSADRMELELASGEPSHRST
jgi:DNA-binding SARP family transcriptional activator